jgi:hypothetical protein
MRPLTVRLAIVVASVFSGLALCLGATRTSHAATYFLPASFASPYYWPAYYPYVTSAYYLPTDYTPYYATSLYVPTYYQYPAVWSTSYVTVSPSPCECAVSAAPVRIIEPSNGSYGALSPAPVDRESVGQPTVPGGSRRPIPLDRESRDDGTISSKVPSPPDVPKADQAQPQGQHGSGGKRSSGASPVEGGKSPSLESAPKSGNLGTERRESLRYTPDRSSPAKRSVLNGRVETDSGDVREGVRVAVVSRTDARLFHAGISDALGTFAIGLEDGDWSVQVTMPSGRVYSVRQIAVANGRVIDDREGREIPSLIISY